MSFLLFAFTATAACCDRAVLFNGSAITNSTDSALSTTGVLTPADVTQLTIEARVMLKRFPAIYQAIVGSWQAAGLGISVCTGGYFEATVFSSTTSERRCGDSSLSSYGYVTMFDPLKRAVMLDRWYNVALVVGAKNATLFIDGTVVARRNFNVERQSVASMVPFLVGGNPVTDGSKVDDIFRSGMIDDVRVVGRALYHGPYTPVHPLVATADILLWYDFDGVDDDPVSWRAIGGSTALTVFRTNVSDAPRASTCLDTVMRLTTPTTTTSIPPTTAPAPAPPPPLTSTTKSPTITSTTATPTARTSTSTSTAATTVTITAESKVATSVTVTTPTSETTMLESRPTSPTSPSATTVSSTALSSSSFSTSLISSTTTTALRGENTASLLGLPPTIGIAVGVIVVVCCCVAIVVLALLRNRRRKRAGVHYADGDDEYDKRAVFAGMSSARDDANSESYFAAGTTYASLEPHSTASPRSDYAAIGVVAPPPLYDRPVSLGLPYASVAAAPSNPYSIVSITADAAKPPATTTNYGGMPSRVEYMQTKDL